jgi:hypothetical protein
VKRKRVACRDTKGDSPRHSSHQIKVKGYVVDAVDEGERSKIDVAAGSEAHGERREKMLRWSFWILFLVAVLCAFIWKFATTG